jgi:hypothetical protein
MKSFLASRYIIPLRSNYSPQHRILKHPISIVHYTTTGKIIVFYILIFTFLGIR